MTIKIPSRISISKTTKMNLYIYQLLYNIKFIYKEIQSAGMDVPQRDGYSTSV